MGRLERQRDRDFERGGGGELGGLERRPGWLKDRGSKGCWGWSRLYREDRAQALAGRRLGQRETDRQLCRGKREGPTMHSFPSRLERYCIVV